VCIAQYMYDFLEAVIMRQTAQEEAYRKLDEMAAKLTETLRKSAKMVSSFTEWYAILDPYKIAYGVRKCSHF